MGLHHACQTSAPSGRIRSRSMVSSAPSRQRSKLSTPKTGAAPSSTRNRAPTPPSPASPPMRHSRRPKPSASRKWRAPVLPAPFAPVFAPFDGDVVFALSTAARETAGTARSQHRAHRRARRRLPHPRHRARRPCAKLACHVHRAWRDVASDGASHVDPKQSAHRSKTPTPSTHGSAKTTTREDELWIKIHKAGSGLKTITRERSDRRCALLGLDRCGPQVARCAELPPALHAAHQEEHLEQDQRWTTSSVSSAKSA
jgi:hypothetical protein